MAYDLTTLRTSVRRRIKDDAYPATEIDEYLQATLNDVFNEYRLGFTETFTDYTLPTSTASLTSGAGLPTTYVSALNLTVTTAKQERQLQNLDRRVLDEMYPDNQDTISYPPGSPRYWYKYGNDIYVFPTSDTPLTLRLRHYRAPNVLADGATPDIPETFSELLVEGAVYRVLQVKDQYDQAGIHKNKYDELLAKLVMRYAQDQTNEPMRMRINRTRSGKVHF